MTMLAEVMPDDTPSRVRHLPVVKTEAETLLSVITKAAKDPTVDVDKLDRLMSMYERIRLGSARAAYAAALSEMQPNLPVITARGRIVVKDKVSKEVIQSTSYALWADINEAIGPVLAQYGFALSFRVGTAPDGKLTVTGILSHREGHQEETTIALAHDSTGSKNAVQAVGSSTSYGKRYTAGALLNLTSREEVDDDGQAGGAPGAVTPEQAGELQALMESVGANREAFLAYMKADSLAEIPASEYERAMAALEKKRAR